MNGRLCLKSSRQPVSSFQPGERRRSEADLQVSFSTVLISLSLCLPPHPVLQMDPVQKAVLHHTLGLPPTAKRKHVSCSVCQLRFNSQVSKFSFEDEGKFKSRECSCQGYTPDKQRKSPSDNHSVRAGHISFQSNSKKQ